MTNAVSSPIDQALVQRVRRRLADRAEPPTPATVVAALEQEPGLHGTATVLDLVDRLQAETIGAGVLEPLLRRDGVTDVVVNGAEAIYVDAGDGLQRTDITLPDEATVRRLAQRLAASAGRRLDDNSPWVDARLPDGTRLHAVLSPLARPGTLISLRVPGRRPLSLADLSDTGMLDGRARQWVERIVARRLSFLVSGGTGTGKTTLLAALLDRVDLDERVLIVEDSSELRPAHPHVVGLEARPANIEGVGQVTVRDLVRQALRMRPDRLVVGEVRGAEVVDLLAAMNTGHRGGCGTVHANSAADVPVRLESLALAAGMSRDAVHAQMAAALDVVLHLGRDADGRRRLVEVGVVEIDRDHRVRCRTAWRLEAGDWIPDRARDGFDRLMAGHQRIEHRMGDHSERGRERE